MTDTPTPAATTDGQCPRAARLHGRLRLCPDCPAGVNCERFSAATTDAEVVKAAAWRWRWHFTDGGAPTDWHLGPNRPHFVNEDGWEVEPLFAATPPSSAPALEGLREHQLEALVRELAIGIMDAGGDVLAHLRDAAMRAQQALSHRPVVDDGLRQEAAILANEMRRQNWAYEERHRKAAEFLERLATPTGDTPGSTQLSTSPPSSTETPDRITSGDTPAVDALRERIEAEIVAVIGDPGMAKHLAIVAANAALRAHSQQPIEQRKDVR